MANETNPSKSSNTGNMGAKVHAEQNERSKKSNLEASIGKENSEEKENADGEQSKAPSDGLIGVVQKTGKDVADAVDFGTKVAAGDYLGATKTALESDLIKKRIKQQLLIDILIIAMPLIIVLVGCLTYFGVVNRMKDQMVNLISSSISTTTGLFSKMWKNLTNDYWTDLEDTEREYIIDNDTGKTIAYINENDKQVIFHKEDLKELVLKKWPDGSKTVYDLTDDELIKLTSEFLSGKNTSKKTYNVIDAYIKDLGDQGIAIKDLRLLGNADYSDEEKILENPNNKELVEKYIAEFLRADYISQNLHKRRVESEEDKVVVNNGAFLDPANQFEIDGGVYLYRTNNKSTINLTPNDFSGGKYYKGEKVEGQEYTIMKYVEYADFMKEIADNKTEAIYHFTIDDKENLVVAQVKITYSEDTSMSPDSEWFEGLEDQPISNKSGEYELEAVTIPYKEYIAKYAMPYEFLINLCQITQNPEFVYHIALLARDTDIALVIQDEVTVDRVVTEVYTEESYYKNTENNNTPSTPTTSPSGKSKSRNLTVTTTEVPKLQIEYADAWNFYDEFEHYIKIEGTLKEKLTDITNTPKNPNPVQDKLRNHHEAQTNPMSGEITQAEYWDDTFITKMLQNVQTINIKTTYEQVSTNSVEKSKQFLGLLRNDNGECLNDCYQKPKRNEDPEALNCAREAVFEEDGYNVSYLIPGTTKREMPLNKLTSGLKMLYAIMQNNSSGYRERDKAFGDDDELYKKYYSSAGVYSNDIASIYVVKMQGIVEHLKYLFNPEGFPENESYTKKHIGDWEDNTGIVGPGGEEITPEPGEEPGDTPIIVEGDIPWKIWCALRNAGYSEYAAAGVLGNIEAESGFDPTAKNGSSGAIGLAQWLGDRKAGLIKYANSKGVDWTDVDTQIEYLVAEISRSGGCNGYAKSQYMAVYANEYNGWLNATNPKDAADYFARWFERPAKTVEAVKRFKSAKRENNAQKWYNLYAGKPLGGGVPGGGGGTGGGGGDSGEIIGEIPLVGENKERMESMIREAIRIANDDSYYYEWGGKSGKGLDCSGFVSMLYRSYFGISVGTSTDAIHTNNQVNKVSMSSLRPGDILWKSGHVALYIGNGRIAESYTDKVPKKDQIRVTTLKAGRFQEAYRIVK